MILRPSHPVLLAAVWIAVASLLPGYALGKGSVVNSPHNLSGSGPASGKAFGNTLYVQDPFQRICIFCHTPHSAQKPTDDAMPLWNRGLSAQRYTPYASPTLKASPLPDQPNGSSRLCLSCHDGTIALGNYGGSPMTDTRMLTGTANLGTDLSDDHPISFEYPNSDQLVPVTALPREVKLQYGTLLQCSSCHDPHDNQFGNFLVLDNRLSGSPLCVACHNPAGWHFSSHDPALNPSLTGCNDCHKVHTAPVPVHLLKASTDAACVGTGCHDGSVGGAAANIKAVLATNVTLSVAAPYSFQSAGRLATAGYHACTDCHNPHQASSSGKSSGVGISSVSSRALPGSLKGVQGTSPQTLVTGVALAEYEICFRCHAGGAVGKLSGVVGSRPNRMITEPDQMKRFDRMNPSFHPVVGDRRGTGASLLSQYRAEMVRIACSDCHNSDQSRKAGGSGPNGPHGSQYEHLLMARYSMPPAGTPIQDVYSPALYDLCFRCHAESYIMGGTSGFVNRGTNEHAAHVKVRGIPCFVCHDPHGVPLQDGATPINNAALINFDRSYTVGAQVVVPVYSRSGTGGSCTVNCHTKGGTTHSYANLQSR